ncbi:MAG: DNA repair protein RadA [Clostridia bacterium]|nr:DNA repair protein RadA [Clostridia bacterium]
MANKIRSVYVCNQCGYENPKWYGKCPQCGEWDTMVEEARVEAKGASASKAAPSARKGVSQPIREVRTVGEHRYQTGLHEFDRVLGGGLVKGSMVLISGDPGIGKSPILLQICQTLGKTLTILYASGEESPHQIKLRAERLGVDSENLFLMSETDAEVVTEQIRSQKPDVVIIDSVQTMTIPELSSSAGSVTQVRECTNLFLHAGKELDIPILVVGHVNKDGNIAGPKVLEHIVDTVLYFEGERNLSYRILRAVKNRFGSTNEIGVFEMMDRGLREVENPSEMMLEGRPTDCSGTCVACAMEGMRPLMAEVQALVTTTSFGNPRRMCSGYDFNRLNVILAVLEKRGGYYFSNSDVYLNVVGGLKLTEPAADLSVALALVSNLKDVVVKSDIIAFGEIGLAGEIRTVGFCEQRIKEAIRLGFHTIIVPKGNLKYLGKDLRAKANIIGVQYLSQAFDAAMPR